MRRFCFKQLWRDGINANIANELYTVSAVTFFTNQLYIVFLPGTAPRWVLKRFSRRGCIFWWVKTALSLTPNHQKGSISYDIPNRFRRFYSGLKAEIEGFQTTVKSSKTVRYIVRYGTFLEIWCK